MKGKRLPQIEEIGSGTADRYAWKADRSRKEEIDFWSVYWQRNLDEKEQEKLFWKLMSVG